jgi:hypothetical protein
MGTELNAYKNLFAPLPQRAQPATPQPQGGASGSSWDVGLGNVGTPAATPTYASTTYTPAPANAPTPGLYAGSPTRLMGAQQDMVQGMAQIFQAGVSRDLAGANQARELAGSLGRLSAGQLTTLANLMNQAGTQAEQVFILKAYVAGEPWQNIVNYANEMRGKPEYDVIRRSTMRDDADVIQQWQDGCGPTVMQTAAGEADPRYAWELNKGGDISKIAPYGENAALAAQQKQWLEQYGGIAVERGQSGGQGIALSQMLNDLLTPITHASYQTQEASSPGQAVEQVAQKLEGGTDVPLRISWGQAGTSGDVGHFVLAMATRGTPGARELQIHDPWTGRTAWVSEANIANNNFAPIFNNYARLSHFYAPQATA